MGDGLVGSVPDPLGRLPVGVVAEGGLQVGMDRLQVDADGGQQLAVAGLGAWEHALGDEPVDPGPGGLQVQPVGHEHAGGQVVALQEQAEQQVLRAEVVVPQAPSLHAGQTGGMAGRPGGVHPPGDRLHGGYLPCPPRRRGPCFWWTACLVTPRRLAICCQDQSLARALSTCRASSTSSRPRRAATARRPTSGSRLLVAAARVAISGSAVFSMPSRYLDDRGTVNPSWRSDPFPHQAITRQGRTVGAPPTSRLTSAYRTGTSLPSTICRRHRSNARARWYQTGPRAASNRSRSRVSRATCSRSRTR